ncbi:hypothetical protein, partial [Phytoactinopolyspora endophytica]|uniref:hypothetical protein n=1 Tax=Phytoactinopolyspora endophytica TaxID=1642495 RepID=UPI00197CA7CA
MAEFDGWWDKILPFWNLLYLGLLTLAMLTTAMSGAHSSGERWGIIALLAVMAVTYIGLGRRLFEAPGGLPAAAYLFVTWSCFYAIILVADRNTSAYFVLFAMFPQIWAFLAARPAAYTSVIVIAGEAITEMQVAGWGWSTAAR